MHKQRRPTTREILCLQLHPLGIPTHYLLGDAGQQKGGTGGQQDQERQQASEHGRGVGGGRGCGDCVWGCEGEEQFWGSFVRIQQMGGGYPWGAHAQRECASRGSLQDPATPKAGQRRRASRSAGTVAGRPYEAPPSHQQKGEQAQVELHLVREREAAGLMARTLGWPTNASTLCSTLGWVEVRMHPVGFGSAKSFCAQHRPFIFPPPLPARGRRVWVGFLPLRARPPQCCQG